MLFIGVNIILPDPRIKLGNELVQKIEQFRQENGRIPVSLEEMGVDYDESGPLYYDVNEDGTYRVSFGTILGESTIYYSQIGEWGK